ncbi:biotin/lipoyl-binding protein [Demequina capsici]|uniref:Biotin/lipoyl-binding protein n=1 Tax=Demequina capsici TaxID=3075620 RepID=A0AA96FBF6_9MICO|nr:biotin/lipoyl-binding protein [Demequina sp. PMTSA13]WNM26275.1 biotin/lipoyl-binding protein [Demequina sp. PMTSA13]
MPKITFRWSRVRAWGIPIVALVAGAGLGVGAMALWGPGGDSAQALPAIDSASGQQTVTVGLQTLEESVSATGTLAAVSSSDLAFQASGQVTAVYHEAGDTVAAGDVIAEIDTLQLTADLTSAQASLAQGEAQLADLEDAADGSDSSDAQIAAAKAQVAVLQQNADDAESAMDDSKLVADISGILTSQPYAVGDVVSAGSSSSGSSSAGATSMGGTSSATSSSSSSSGVTIVGQDEWTVSVSLTEAEVAEIAVGDQVTFTSDDYDGEFYGIVSDIANLPTTTGGSATYAVDLQVTGTVEGLFEGTSVDADIVYLRATDVLAIPTNAITTTDGVSTVTAVDDSGNQTATEVTTGDTIGSYTEITDGLSEGDQILVTVTTGSTSSDSSSSSGDMSGFGGQMPNFDSSGGQMPGGMGQMPSN